MSNLPVVRGARRVQFALCELIECLSCCAIVAATTRVIGPAAAGFLMVMALAFLLRHGAGALTAFAAAMLSSGLASAPASEGSVGSAGEWAAVWVAFAGGVMAAWQWRRNNGKLPRHINRVGNSCASSELATHSCTDQLERLQV